MVVYFIIGLIVSLMETFMMLRDLKKYGLTMCDVVPTLSSYGDLEVAITIAMTIGGIALIWPLQVCYWIYRIISRKTVQEEDLA